MVDLRDFQDGEGPDIYDEPPLVHYTPYTTAIRTPGDNGKVAGHTGIDEHRGRVFLTIRKFQDHFYRRGGGYAISTKVLEAAEEEGVNRVLIWESDQQRTYEFALSRYLNGQKVPAQHTPAGDEQRYVEINNHLGRFEQLSAPTIDTR